MPLPRSRPVPAFAEHDEALRSALVHVAETASSASRYPSTACRSPTSCATPRWTTSTCRPRVSRGWSTEVSFTGTFDGAIEVAMNEALARQLLQAFLGLGPDDPTADDQLFDVTCEFASQVCGTWLTGRLWRPPLRPGSALTPCASRSSGSRSTPRRQTNTTGRSS